MNRKRYTALLKGIKEFFNVSDSLRDELNTIALNEHGISLDCMLDSWARLNSNLSESSYIELMNHLNMLNTPDYCISDMVELYDFVYDFDAIEPPL